MEKLQGPINPCFLGEDLEVGWLEEFVSNIGNNYKVEDPYCVEGGDTRHYTLPSLEDKMPFLQMLQGVEAAQEPQLAQSAAFPFMQEPNFQFLLRLQHQKLMMEHHGLSCNFNSNAELESCITNINNNHDIIMDLHSPVKSETCREGDVHVPTVLSQKCSTDQNQKVQGRSKRNHLPRSSPSSHEEVAASNATTRERRKRKRSVRPAKNIEEVETQRMTHIAVERNRRRQMNDHLNALRSLMPPSYVQRGDQASIIGGAIDFVKELEQLLQSLQAQKRMRQSEDNGDVSASSSTSSSSNVLNNMFMTSPSSPFQFRNFHSFEEGNVISTECTKSINEEFSAENRSPLANIEVVVIHNHVNLKIQCQRRPGQLLRAIVAFEDLRLTILHLNITSLHNFVHYSFNLKMEDGCKLGTADEVASAVQQIFTLINLS